MFKLCVALEVEDAPNWGDEFRKNHNTKRIHGWMAKGGSGRWAVAATGKWKHCEIFHSVN